MPVPLADPALLAATLEQSSEAVALVAPAGPGGPARIAYANPAFALLTGLDPSAEGGRLLVALEAMADDPGFVSRLRNAVAQGQPFAGEVGLRAAGEDPIPVEVRIAPWPAGAESPTYWIGLARSLRERRDLEARLWQSQRLDAVAQLADGVAHDFSNILVALAGYSRLLLEGTGAGDPRLEDTRAIARAAERAELLIRFLLQFARRREVVAEPVAPNAVLEEMVPVLGGMVGEQVRLLVDLDPRAGLVHMDRGQLQQVLVNLVTNARDAMPGGGTLTLATRANVPDPGRVVAAGTAYTAHVVLTVADTGSGMTPEVKGQLFTPFFSTRGRGPGSGLGLATVRRIVEQAGGYIWVQSAPGEGTTVQIALPWAGAAAAVEATPPPPAAPAGGAETVLLVEDDPAVLRLSRRVLERYGYTVLAAGSAAEATAIAAERGAELRLMVTDVVMPGQRGPDLARELLAEWPHLRLLFISGYADAAPGGEEGPLPGPILAKPFQPDELARAVRAALDGASRG